LLCLETIGFEPGHDDRVTHAFDFQQRFAIAVVHFELGAVCVLHLAPTFEHECNQLAIARALAIVTLWVRARADRAARRR
jgi:hypothetical protein